MKKCSYVVQGTEKSSTFHYEMTPSRWPVNIFLYSAFLVVLLDGHEIIHCFIFVGRQNGKYQNNMKKSQIFVTESPNYTLSLLSLIVCLSFVMPSSVLTVYFTRTSFSFFRCSEVHHHCLCHCLWCRPSAVPGPLLWLCHGRILQGQRQACPHHLRRSVQAGL